MSRLPLRGLMFGAAALMLAGGTVFLSTGRAQKPAGDAAAEPPVALATILVATRALAAGTTVKPGDVGWRPWPSAALDKAYIVRAGAAQPMPGGILRTAVEAGEPLTSGRMLVTGSASALAAITAPGSRAVSISLTPTSGVSGLIIPGDHVDVVLTYALPRPVDGGGGIERRAAATILSNLHVLAIDQRMSGAPADAKDVRNASLEVTVKQSEILALAADLGKLSLSLHSLVAASDDADASANSNTADYQVGRLLPGFRSAAAPAASRRRMTRTAAPRAAASAVVEFHGAKSNATAPQ